VKSREELRQKFDQVAVLYDRARPHYPEELFDDLFALAALGPAPAVLEIGCGTGQASVSLARRGSRLVCIELGPHLAEIARSHLAEFRDVRVITADFETWELPERPFDMVFAAKSWHWLDPGSRYGRVARLLRAGGMFALVTGGHAFPEGFDPFFTEIQGCYDAIGESMAAWPPPRPEEAPTERDAIENSGWFVDVHVKRYVWAADYTASGYIDLLQTHSRHIAMDPAKRHILFAEIRRRIEARPGRLIRKHDQAILHTARRTARE